MVTIKQALEALRKLTENPQRIFEASMTSELEEHASVIAQFIAEVHIRKAPVENTGLPCPYCGESLPKLVLESHPDGEMTVRISTKGNYIEIENIIKLLNAVGGTRGSSSSALQGRPAKDLGRGRKT